MAPSEWLLLGIFVVNVFAVVWGTWRDIAHLRYRAIMEASSKERQDHMDAFISAQWDRQFRQLGDNLRDRIRDCVNDAMLTARAQDEEKK